MFSRNLSTVYVAICVLISILPLASAYGDEKGAGDVKSPLDGVRLKLPTDSHTLSDTRKLSSEVSSYLDSNATQLNRVLQESSQYLNKRMFEEARQLVSAAQSDYPDVPDLLVRHAEALAGLNGGALEGEPFDILSRSLDIDHNHKPSLWLMALYNQQAGNHEAALIIFHALKQRMGSDSGLVEVVDKAIAISIAYIDNETSPVKEK
ncbi:MAG: tetratricopeptide repeat protein [Granulosicoccus sp.]